MALRQVLHTLLIWLAPAWLVVASGCESDASDIEPSVEESVPVLTCLVEAGGELKVSVVGSVSYSDTARVRLFENVIVSLTLGDTLTYHQRDAEGNGIVSFPQVRLTHGDSLSLYVTADDRVLQATATVPSVVPILSLDTASTFGRRNLEFFLSMEDNPATSDGYQVEVRRRAYAQGEVADSVIACNYASYIFSMPMSLIGSRGGSVGLFDDSEMSSSLNMLRFDVQRDALRAPKGTEPDSMAVVVRLYHHSSDYYSFLQSVAQVRQMSLLPVFGSSVIHSNVKGGYGIVAAIAYDERVLSLDNANADD